MCFLVRLVTGHIDPDSARMVAEATHQTPPMRPSTVPGHTKCAMRCPKKLRRAWDLADSAEDIARCLVRDYTMHPADRAIVRVLVQNYVVQQVPASDEE
tara:strand:- start:1417 stop:1713 length:297 start_codon:yes stop_codon:yes gene_type:complete